MIRSILCVSLLLPMKTVVSPVNIDERRALAIVPGNTVRVWQKIQEKGKIRLQAYEGLVIARKHGSEAGATFTVRRTASGVGMEKIFPLYSPIIDSVELVKTARVRRSKLYFIREKAAKEVSRRLKHIMVTEGRDDAATETAPESKE